MSSIRVEHFGSQYIARGRYEDKDLIKAAGFRWDPGAKQWYTTDAAIAAKLDDVEGLRQRIASANTAKVEAIEASRASESDADIPRPEGLEYLPYQRAGIAYARRFPTVLIGDDMGLGKTIQAIGIINDDMPFLVDSIASTISAHGLTIDRLVHPVVAVRRDAEGQLCEVVDGAAAGEKRESMVYLETQRGDARQRRQLEQALAARAVG